MTRVSFPHLKAATAKLAVAVLVFVLAAPLGALPADARAGGGFSFGSRGSQTFSMPAPTNTWRGGVSPYQWTERQRSPSTPFGAGQPRRFGFGSGLAAGLLGAGLFGLLSGNGFFGGIGGLFSLFGLLLQFALIAGLVMLVMNLFRSRFAPLGAGYGPRATTPGFGAGLGLGSTPRPQPVQVGPNDYAAFERLLADIQTAYSREDLNALSRFATPEVARYFASDLQDNARRGVRNDISGVRLLQGDLSEAWREGGTDFATVAMRFAAVDVMLDRASGRVVAGDPNRPVEAVEIWTFRRDMGGAWLLSGVQQTQ